MLEHTSIEFRESDERLLDKVELIRLEEEKIDMRHFVYLITWSPDPKELPDCDFHICNQTNIETLARFLKCCKCGLFCLEANMMGNVHYHGWFQIDSKMEPFRLAILKTMERFGPKGLKVTKATHIKINSYSERMNGLYYYKKDAVDAMLIYEDSVIHRDSYSTINWELCDLLGFFDIRGDKRVQAKDRVSTLQYYRKFYEDSLLFRK